MAEFVKHEPCPNCGSKDNLARYSDDSAYCFGCEYYEKGDGEGPPEITESSEVFRLPAGFEARAVLSRKINVETAKKFSYLVGELNGKPAHLAIYRDLQGRQVAAKVRYPDKTFTWLGNAKEVGLFGDHLWRQGGRKVVVTEGEIDALSVSQSQDNKWPVVSIPNGAAGATRSIRKCISWLEKFDEVVFMFDSDEAGRTAAQACAQLLTPGKAKIASLPLKDANELLKANRGREIIDAIWDAKEYRPDGIVAASDLWDAVRTPVEPGLSFPWTTLTKVTMGLMPRTMVMLTGGSGTGKSAMSREIAYHLLMEHKQRVGYIALEESTARTLRGFLGIHIEKPLWLPGVEVDDGELERAFEAVARSGRLYLYDSFGSLQTDVLLERIRYLAVACECRYIFLDHISIAVSGLDIADERKALDVLCTKLRSLCEETGATIVAIVHLKRPKGDKGFEDGLQISLASLRGSGAIGQLSDTVIGFERNQQDPKNSNVTNVRVVKNRLVGETGLAGSLYYDKETGRITEGKFVNLDMEDLF